jgi:fimbrial chaperone protein
VTTLAFALARRALPLLRGALAVALVVAALPAAAQEYSVSPMRIELDRSAQSAVVTLRNLGATPIDFQVVTREWTQDADGRDVYADTADLVYFPKIFTVEPNEERVVRIGAKALPAGVERTFRLFVERIPPPAKEAPKPGAQVAINVRFALPVFVRPPAPVAQGTIESAALERGTLTARLRNTGNVHLRMDEGVGLVGRDAAGAQVFATKLEDRYVLAGATKRLAAPIPRSACAQLATVEIVAAAEQLTLSRRLDVGRASCE